MPLLTRIASAERPLLFRFFVVGVRAVRVIGPAQPARRGNAVAHMHPEDNLRRSPLRPARVGLPCHLALFWVASLRPSRVVSCRAARPASVRSFLPRRRSCRRGRSHSYAGTPACSRNRTSPAPVAARALDRDRWFAELPRPAKQGTVTRRRRRYLVAIELAAEPVERDSDVNVLVGVDADRDRPLHHLASFSSRHSTGLDRAVSGKGRRLLSGQRPVERSDGGRQVGFKARQIPPAWLWVIPPSLRTLDRSSDRTVTQRRHTAWLSHERCSQAC